MNIPYQKALHGQITKDKPYINWFKSKRGENKSDRMFNNRKTTNGRNRVQYIPETPIFPPYNPMVNSYLVKPIRINKQRIIKHNA